MLGRLADLLDGEGHVVITTMWPEQWNTYTAAARAGPGAADPAGTAGRLLERLPELTGRDPARIEPARGGVVDVPDRFTSADLDAAARAGDGVLAEAAAAAAAAGQDGQVTQYLAGVPDLLRRYAGTGGDPYGQAVITAAMDAARLGHASPLPAELLQEAAVGYLTGPRRTKDIATWRETALAWATEELHGAVRALQPVPPEAGTGVVGYQVADYLDQHGRLTRKEQLGPPSLWDALTTHTTSVGDLTRLGHAAQHRGLYRHAAALWTIATGLGSARAAGWLVAYLRHWRPGDTARAGLWAAAHVSLDDPDVGGLLGALHRAGADDAVTTLLARDPAAHVSLDNPWDVAALVEELREFGLDDAVTTLLARDPAAHVSLDDTRDVTGLLGALHIAGADEVALIVAAWVVGHVSPDDPGDVAGLLQTLREFGLDDAIAALLARDPAAHVSLDNPRAVTALVEELREFGLDNAVTTLVARDPAAHVSLDDTWAVAAVLQMLREFGLGDAVAALLARDPAARVSLDDPGAVAELLQALREAGADHAVAALLARDPAARVSLDDPGAVAELLQALREAGADHAVAALLARDPAAHVSLDDPGAVAELLQALREAGADHAVAALLARDPATHVSVNWPPGVTALVESLRAAGADHAVTVLASRVANAGEFNLFLNVFPVQASSYPFGREADGTPSQSWNWQEPASQN